VNDITKLATWIQENRAGATAAITGAGELFAALAPLAASQNKPVGLVLTGIPSADRAIADAVDVAAIAGRTGASIEAILSVATILKDVAIALI